MNSETNSLKNYLSPAKYDALIREKVERLKRLASDRFKNADDDLYEKQQAFVYAQQHHLAFVAGIGSGKTWSGGIRAGRAAYGYIGKDKILDVPNLGVVTAPTYPMLRDATVRTFLDVNDEYIEAFNKAEMVARLKNGSEVLFRSTEHPDRLRGPSITWWWGD
jgi:hypothetical protein